MSEEEIMQVINRTISFMKEELKAEHSCFTIKELWALQGLVDLYQTAKDRGIELATTIDALETDYQELEEKNKELYEIKYVASTFIERTMKQFSIGEFRYKVNNFKDNYISKDKIRKIIDKHKRAKRIAEKQLTENIIIADTESLNYGRKEAHEVAIYDLEKLL